MPIKYIGSKRVLIPRILELVRSLPSVTHVLDLFSGTARVGHALKKAGYQVTSNDHLSFAHVIARCYVQADATRHARKAERIIKDLNKLEGRAGYVTETFCEKSRYFHPKNGERIDAIRDEIQRLSLPGDLEAILLVSLMEAADRVDSTTGVQMAYLKSYAPRAQNELLLRLPEVLPGKGKALKLEAVQAAKKVDCDLAYLDPPYNQHSYLGNYHVWETLVRWDAPEHYGVACKRVDCRERHSSFNRKREIESAFLGVLEKIRARYLLVSFNDEGHLGRDEIETMLARFGSVRIYSQVHERYVGAKIGIHDLKGRKVGKVGRLRNQEFFFLVDTHERSEALPAESTKAAP